MQTLLLLNQINIYLTDHTKEDPVGENLIKDNTAENKAENKDKSSLTLPKAIEPPLEVAKPRSIELIVSSLTIPDLVEDYNQRNQLCSQIRTYLRAQWIKQI